MGGKEEGQLRNELARLKAQLDERLDSLHGLEVNEATYLELIGKPEKALSLRDMALLRLGDVVIPLRRDLDAAQNALEEHRSALQNSSLTVEMQLAEMERQRRAHDSLLTSLKLEKLSLEASLQGMTAQLESEINLRRVNEEKASLFDEAAKELKQMRADNEELRSIVDKNRSVIATLVESEAAARRAAAEESRRTEMLRMDKEYLSTEVKSLSSGLETRTREWEASSSRAMALELRVAEVTDQLLALQRSAGSELDLRLQREIDRLREDGQREVELVKQSARDVTERENRVLRESRDAADAEVARLRGELSRAVEQASSRERELAAKVARTESDLNSVRTELRLKAFELAALGASFEDRMAQLRQSQLDVELFREEGLALRAALSTLERESEGQQQRLQTELHHALARLAGYAAWESEVDAAVEATEGLPGDIYDSKGAAENQSLRALLAGIGSNAQGGKGAVSGILERRLAHTVRLAQKLREKEFAVTRLTEEVERLKANLQAAQSAAEKSVVDSERSLQPASYLVQRLRVSEDECAVALAKMRELESEINEWKELASRAETEAAGLRERLSAVLQQREEVLALQRTLEEMRHQQLEQQRQLEEQEQLQMQVRAEQERILEEEEIEKEAEVRRQEGEKKLNNSQQAAVMTASLGSISEDLLRRFTSPPSATATLKKWHQRVILE